MRSTLSFPVTPFPSGSAHRGRLARCGAALPTCQNTTTGCYAGFMTDRTFRETFEGLLTRLEEGDRTAFDRASELLYDQLRRIAHAHRRRWQGNETLNTTVLVHEAYLKLVDGGGLAFDGRDHFLSVASRAMRQLLCNYARDRKRLKRGGALRRTGTGVDHLPARLDPTDLETLIALDDALHRLSEIDERLTRVVECRFFAGLSIPETAEALDTSPATVKRDWGLARAWLYEALAGETPG